jgi:hypothetical protein
MRKTATIAVAVMFFAVSQVSAKPQDSQSQTQSQSQSRAQSKSPAQAQPAKPQAQKESVAEAARKAREAQKNAPKAPVVFTNDNIGGISGNINVIGNASAPSAAAPAAPAAGQAAAAGSDEAAWRKKFADAHAKLSQDQQELAILQRELSVAQVQYYPDPNKALAQSVTNSDVYKKQQDIAKMQKQVQADQKALSDLEDALRKAGGDASWARE